ncbi:preprotein translocase subunit SecE [Zunongwangia sp. F363]|uniref:Protein translocase subunit SecE n=1 Tax=Autumnicola tepida TaxID=3075595 RepID=A0ABU3C9I2_9FLAO|nr:preprotein translocase subunit SecE [Zunongwangia sp. F363]MDT0642996.1 preprotein translocase subunit SecE [Zunongwangia sp. F363]
MAGIVNYISESYNELKNHVTWTSWPEAQRLTIVVAAFSIVFSLVVWGVDSLFSQVIEHYFEWIKS